MKTLLFALSFSTMSVLVLGVVVSIISSTHRIWPISERNWKFWFTWTLWPVSIISAIGVGILDWGSYVLPRPLSLVGTVLFVGGILIGLESMRELGKDETEGMEGNLHTGGAYQYSRNPQYVGGVLLTVGFALLTNSRLVILLGTIHLAYYLLLPFAEEPWLQEQYGKSYREYRESVPRFLGTKTFEQISGGTESNGESRNP